MRSNQTLLWACAALGALSAAAPASAQSSLNINGMVDLGVFRGFNGVTQVGTVQRSNVAITGVEDLGNGVQVLFRLSTRFEADTGASEGAGYKPFWYDESTVGLRGPWGTVRFGHAMTALWANDWKFDPWNNFNRIASPAWQHWHYLTPSDPFGNKGTGEYGRIDNGIFYDSPTVGGVTVRLSTSPELQRETGATRRPVSAVLEYGKGAVTAMAAIERNSIGDRVTFFAGKYTFGAVAVMAAFDDSRAFLTPGRSLSTTLSATYRVSPSVIFKSGLSRQRLNGEANQFASLGADYALSRRTTLTASLGRQWDAAWSPHASFGVSMAHSF